MHGSTVALSYRWWTVSEGDEKGDFFLSGRAAGAGRSGSPVRYPFRSSSAPPVSPRASALAPRRLPRATRYDCRALRARLGRGVRRVCLAARAPCVPFRFLSRASRSHRSEFHANAFLSGSRPLSVRPAGRARRGLGSPSPRPRRDGFYFESNFRLISARLSRIASTRSRFSVDRTRGPDGAGHTRQESAHGARRARRAAPGFDQADPTVRRGRTACVMR